jgi:hypothetical protein
VAVGGDLRVMDVGFCGLDVFVVEQERSGGLAEQLRHLVFAGLGNGYSRSAEQRLVINCIYVNSLIFKLSN